MQPTFLSRVASSSCNKMCALQIQIHKYKNTQIQNTQIQKYTNTQIHKYTNTQIHKYTNTQIQKYKNTKIHKYTITQIHKYTNTQIYKYKQSRARSPRSHLRTDWIEFGPCIKVREGGRLKIDQSRCSQSYENNEGFDWTGN